MNQNPNQPNSQTPPNPQAAPSVPDHRIEEVMNKMRQLELQNSQLRGQIEYMAGQGKGQTQGQQPPPSPFKPEVQAEIEKIVNGRLEQERVGFRQQIGMLYDQVDQVNFATKYSNDKFSKFHGKVEQLRQEYQARNQYITREDALRMVYFEETGTKAPAVAPVQQAAPATKQPVYDPYFQQYVDPDTGKPVAPPALQTAEDPAAPAPQAQWQQPPPAAQQQWNQAPQAPAPQAQPTGGNYPGQRMQPGAAHPNTNPFGQTFQLPNQGVNQQATPTHQAAANARNPLSLESSDADLAAFENQFGDIPL